MAWVVFLRGVNVGGHRAFRPAAVASELARLGVVNVGAAGTFVVREPIGQAALRATVLRALPFEAELMICRGSELTQLAFPGPARGAVMYTSILARRPLRLPPLPIRQPEGADWLVSVLAIEGRFALSLCRRLEGRSLVYPNEVVEKKLGIHATTRNWNTIESIRAILERPRA